VELAFFLFSSSARLARSSALRLCSFASLHIGEQKIVSDQVFPEVVCDELDSPQL